MHSHGHARALEHRLAVRSQLCGGEVVAAVKQPSSLCHSLLVERLHADGDAKSARSSNPRRTCTANLYKYLQRVQYALMRQRLANLARAGALLPIGDSLGAINTRISQHGRFTLPKRRLLCVP